MRLTLAAPAADGADGHILVAMDGGKFTHSAGAPDVTLPEGWKLTPGLVDLQVNGIDDVFPLEDPSRLPDLDALLAARGVARYLVAAPTADPAAVHDLARAAAEFTAGGDTGCAGLHLEGPVLSPAHAGAHPIEHLRNGDDAQARALLDLPGVRLVTLAPEVQGGLAYAAEATARGIAVAAGHTGMSAAQANEAIARGITLATHIFNAMTPIHQRAPGCALVYLLHPGARPTFIADGVHLADELVELILRLAGDRAILVSDAAPSTGVQRARPNDGRLAGSEAGLFDGVCRLVHTHGLSHAQAAHLASGHPANVLGNPHPGVFAPGASADLTIVDSSCDPVGTIRNGEFVYQTPECAALF
ncbi:MAG: amidohydrolase family protein [Actinomycetota bacterium]